MDFLEVVLDVLQDAFEYTKYSNADYDTLNREDLTEAVFGNGECAALEGIVFALGISPYTLEAYMKVNAAYKDLYAKCGAEDADTVRAAITRADILHIIKGQIISDVKRREEVKRRRFNPCLTNNEQ